MYVKKHFVHCFPLLLSRFVTVNMSAEVEKWKRARSDAARKLKTQAKCIPGSLAESILLGELFDIFEETHFDFTSQLDVLKETDETGAARLSKVSGKTPEEYYQDVKQTYNDAVKRQKEQELRRSEKEREQELRRSEKEKEQELSKLRSAATNLMQNARYELQHVGDPDILSKKKSSCRREMQTP